MLPEDLKTELTNIVWEAMDAGIDESEIMDTIQELLDEYEPVRIGLEDEE